MLSRLGRLVPLLAGAVALLIIACDDPSRPPTTGSITPVVVWLPQHGDQDAGSSALDAGREPSPAEILDPAPYGRLAPREEPAATFAATAQAATYPAYQALAGQGQAFSGVRVRVQSGSTIRTQDLTPSGNGWTGTISNLPVGTYTVFVEGMVGDLIDHYAVRTGVVVAAGSNTGVTVEGTSFRPGTVTPPSPTSAMQVTLGFSQVPNAEGYQARWSKNSDATGKPWVDVQPPTATIAVSDTGTWYAQVRATRADLSVESRPTDPVSFEILGDQIPTQLGADSLGFGQDASGTRQQINIAPADDVDWFGIVSCQADSVHAQVRIAGLTPPSNLIPILQIRSADTLTVLAADTAAAGQDAEVHLRLPVDGRHELRVAGNAGSTGHYELALVVVNRPNNTGSACASGTVTTITVEQPATLTSIGATQQLHAVARNATDDEIPGKTFTWSSADTTIAVVDPATGVVTAVRNGAVQITASTDGVNGHATVTVAQVPTAVTISPPEATLAGVGASVQLTATAHDSGGTAVTGITFTWTTSDETIAQVSDAGLVTAQGQGAVTISASAAGVVGDASITVQIPASIRVLPGGAGVSGIGNTVTFDLQALDEVGQPIADYPLTAAWSTLNPHVATIDPASGVASAVRNGQVVVRAETEELGVGHAVLTVSVTPASVPNVFAAVPTPVTGGSVYGIWGAHPDRVIASTAFLTADTILAWDGTSWSVDRNATGFGFTWNTWGFGENDIYVTGRDGGFAGRLQHFNGTSWTPLENPAAGLIRDIWGPAPDDIYIVGDFNGIHRRREGDWSTVNAPGVFLGGIWGSSANDIWAVGSSGTVRRYDGETWTGTTNTEGVATMLWAVWGSSSSDVWIVGDGGWVLHWNGTAYDMVQQLDPTVEFAWVWGTGPDNVYALGGSRLYHYDGVSWKRAGGVVDNPLRSGWGTADGDIWIGVAIQGLGVFRGHYDGSVVATPSATSVRVGSTVEISAEAFDGFSDPLPGAAIIRYSLDPAIATVNQSGLVTGLAEGEARIVSQALGGAADTSFVTVVPSITVGETEPLASTVSWSADSVLATGITLTEQTEVTHLGMLARDAAGSARLALYTDSGNLPAAFIAQSNPFTIGSAGTYETAIEGGPVTLDPGVYWIAHHYNASTPSWFQMSAGNPGRRVCHGARDFTLGFPNPFGTPTCDQEPERINYYLRGWQFFPSLSEAVSVTIFEEESAMIGEASYNDENGLRLR